MFFILSVFLIIILLSYRNINKEMFPKKENYKEKVDFLNV